MRVWLEICANTKTAATPAENCSFGKTTVLGKEAAKRTLSVHHIIMYTPRNIFRTEMRRNEHLGP